MKRRRSSGRAGSDAGRRGGSNGGRARGSGQAEEKGRAETDRKKALEEALRAVADIPSKHGLDGEAPDGAGTAPEEAGRSAEGSADDLEADYDDADFDEDRAQAADVDAPASRPKSAPGPPPASLATETLETRPKAAPSNRLPGAAPKAAVFRHAGDTRVNTPGTVVVTGARPKAAPARAESGNDEVEEPRDASAGPGKSEDVELQENGARPKKRARAGSRFPEAQKETEMQETEPTGENEVDDNDEVPSVPTEAGEVEAPSDMELDKTEPVEADERHKSECVQALKPAKVETGASQGLAETADARPADGAVAFEAGKVLDPRLGEDLSEEGAEVDYDAGVDVEEDAQAGSPSRDQHRHEPMRAPAGGGASQKEEGDLAHVSIEASLRSEDRDRVSPAKVILCPRPGQEDPRVRRDRRKRDRDVDFRSEERQRSKKSGGQVEGGGQRDDPKRDRARRGEVRRERDSGRSAADTKRGNLRGSSRRNFKGKLSVFPLRDEGNRRGRREERKEEHRGSRDRRRNEGRQPARDDSPKKHDTSVRDRRGGAESVGKRLHRADEPPREREEVPHRERQVATRDSDQVRHPSGDTTSSKRPGKEEPQSGRIDERAPERSEDRTKPRDQAPVGDEELRNKKDEAKSGRGRSHNRKRREGSRSGDHGGEDGGRSEHGLTSPRRKGAEILSTDAVPDVVQSSRAKVLADLANEMPLTDDEDEEAASQTHSDEGAARSLPARAPHDRESEDDTGQVRASHGEESAEDSQTARLKELIRAVYKRRNPSKLVEVNSLLLKYVGHELEMYHRICEKYSEEPEDVGPILTPQRAESERRSSRRTHSSQRNSGTKSKTRRNRDKKRGKDKRRRTPSKSRADRKESVTSDVASAGVRGPVGPPRGFAKKACAPAPPQKLLAPQQVAPHAVPPHVAPAETQVQEESSLAPPAAPPMLAPVKDTTPLPTAPQQPAPAKEPSKTKSETWPFMEDLSENTESSDADSLPPLRRPPPVKPKRAAVRPPVRPLVRPDLGHNTRLVLPPTAAAGALPQAPALRPKSPDSESHSPDDIDAASSEEDNLDLPLPLPPVVLEKDARLLRRYHKIFGTEPPAGLPEPPTPVPETVPAPPEPARSVERDGAVGESTEPHQPRLEIAPSLPAPVRIVPSVRRQEHSWTAPRPPPAPQAPGPTIQELTAPWERLAKRGTALPAQRPPPKAQTAAESVEPAALSKETTHEPTPAQTTTAKMLPGQQHPPNWHTTPEPQSPPHASAKMPSVHSFPSWQAMSAGPGLGPPLLHSAQPPPPPPSHGMAFLHQTAPTAEGSNAIQSGLVLGPHLGEGLAPLPPPSTPPPSTATFAYGGSPAMTSQVPATWQVGSPVLDMGTPQGLSTVPGLGVGPVQIQQWQAAPPPPIVSQGIGTLPWTGSLLAPAMCPVSGVNNPASTWNSGMMYYR